MRAFGSSAACSMAAAEAVKLKRAAGDLVEAENKQIALRINTINGAYASHEEAIKGSITPGKQADLLLLRADGLNLQPIHDPISTVVMQSNPSNIDSVMVAGVWRKRHGHLLCDYLDSAIEELGESARRIRQAVGLQPADIT